jgi:hypothetical protein
MSDLHNKIGCSNSDERAPIFQKLLECVKITFCINHQCQLALRNNTWVSMIPCTTHSIGLLSDDDFAPKKNQVSGFDISDQGGPVKGHACTHVHR